jgi:hypothetical protein
MTRRDRSLAAPLILGAVGAALFAGAYLVASKPRSARAGEAFEEPSGEWLLAGPFSAEGLSGLEDPLDRDFLAGTKLAAAGEGSAAPLRVTGSGSRPWRESKGGAEGLDLAAELGPSANAVAYAYRELEAPASGEAAIKVSSDDGVKLWVNGHLFLADHARRALAPDQDAVIVPLEKGRNRILVKVSQAEGAWSFSLRVQSLADARRAEAGRAAASVAAFPDELCVRAGAFLPESPSLDGCVMTRPALCSGEPVLVELLDEAGIARARADSRVGGRFSLRVPKGMEGIATLRASFTGKDLAGDLGPASPLAQILIGDPESIAVRAARDARDAAAGEGKAPDSSEGPTLEYLALTLEGRIPLVLGGFEAGLRALREIESASRAKGRASASFPRGLAQEAFRSSLDGSLQPYSLYLPSGYSESRRYGLVVALHGASGNDHDTALAFSGCGAGGGPADMLVLAPYARGDSSYAYAGERDVLDAIRLVMKRYAIDQDRVYLTGSSMGGFGAWRLAKLYPSLFAAVAPFAGWTSLESLENLAAIPVLAVHGEADATVPPGPDERAVEFLSSIGGRARLELLPGAGHDAFGAYTSSEGPGRLLAWFRCYKREAWPKEQRIRTTMARAGKGAWAEILGLRESRKASALDADLVDERHIRVDTENVAAFALDLRHPALAKGGRILVLADGVNVAVDSGKAEALFELGPSGSFRLAAPAAGLPKNEGSGLAALLESPLVISYGSKTKKGAERNERAARALAAAMAGARIAPPAILPDSRIAAEAPRLLVGSPDDSEEIARLEPRLPFAWKDGLYTMRGAATVCGDGLILVCPDPERPGRLLGLLSLPPGLAKAQDLARALAAPLGEYGVDGCGYGTPDVILLRASGEVIWSGSFDWRWSGLRGSTPASE